MVLGPPGKMENKRFSGSIVLKNNKMQEMVRYTFQHAWVVSWEGPKLNSEGSSLAIETIEIAIMELMSLVRMPPKIHLDNYVE